MTTVRRWLFPSLLLAFLVTGCGEKGSIEDQVRERIRAMEAAGEAGERLTFMGFVAEGFEAQEGAMNREDFQRYMFLQMNRQRRIQAQLFPIAVDVLGANLAEARFKVLVTGGAGLIPEEGRLFDVSAQWAFEDGDWMLWRADWRAATP